MTHNTKNLEESIYALQNKASNINEKIKRYNKSSVKNLEIKDRKLNIKNHSIDKDTNQEYNINRLEKELEIEILELKKKQKILSLIFYIIIVIFFSSFIVALELYLI